MYTKNSGRSVSVPSIPITGHFQWNPIPKFSLTTSRRIYTCAYEAGFSGFVLYEALWESFIECLVIHPADIPTSHKETQFKTDSRDALKIAKSLRAGQLQSIHIPDKLLQQERSLVRTRQQLTADLVRYKCRVKSLLAFYNISIPEQFQKANWNNDMRGWLWDLEFPCDIGAKSIRFLMSMLEYTRASLLSAGLLPSGPLNSSSKSATSNDSPIWINSRVLSDLFPHLAIVETRSFKRSLPFAGTSTCVPCLSKLHGWPSVLTLLWLTNMLNLKNECLLNRLLLRWPDPSSRGSGSSSSTRSNIKKVSSIDSFQRGLMLNAFCSYIVRLPSIVCFPLLLFLYRICGWFSPDR